jgi:hypothetical protein
MERFQELGDAAVSKIKLADHMLTVTYPVVNDPKLLIGILANVFQGCDDALTALLEYERMFKNIPPYPDNFEGKVHLFNTKIKEKYSFDDGFVNYLRSMRDILHEHKQSSIEFVKNNEFVMGDKEYKLTTISVNQLKELILKAKKYTHQILIITSKNATIFR